jgi:AraC-like DNA-binding protein
LASERLVVHVRGVLMAASDWADGASQMRTTIFLSRELRAQHVRRAGLVLDSRFVAHADKPLDVVTVMLVREGTLCTSGGARASGTSAWILGEDELERVVPGATTVRLWGDPFVSVSLVVPRARVQLPIGAAYGPRPLGSAVWEAFDAMPPPGDVTDAHAQSLVALLDRLADEGVVARAIADDARKPDEHPAATRLWTKLAERYEKQDSAVYVDLFSVAMGSSPRQITRGLQALTRQFLFFGGFRESLRVLRLRRAALLLSAPSLRASDVARLVGYGSVDAMGRAFRDAGFPSATEIRKETRADHAA